MMPSADMSEESGRTGRETLGLVAWRDALASGPVVPDAQDLRDWMVVIGEAGWSDGARLLRDCAALLQGFPLTDDAGKTTAVGGGWTTTIAVDELIALARAFPGADAPTVTPVPKPPYSGYPDNPVGIRPTAPASDMSVDIEALLASLTDGLRQEGGGHEAQTLGSSLELLVELQRRSPAFDYRRYKAGSIDLVCRAIAQTVLVDFALATRDLWTAPLGSVALFRTSARLGRATLGPYFTNAGCGLRHVRDVYDLARRAAAAGGRAGDREVIGGWIVLLSRGCSGPLIEEIIHDLGDYLASAPLAAILERVTTQSPAKIDYELIRQMRDVGIDTRDYALAARAQKAIVAGDPSAAHEKLILGDIYATGGDYAQAETVYRQLLAIGPDKAVMARLAMVRRDEFEHYEIHTGYHSPADRLASRLYNGDTPPRYARRKGQVIAAVNVN